MTAVTARTGRDDPAGSASPGPEPVAAPSGRRRGLRGVVAVLLMVGLVAGVRTFVAEPERVGSSSMSPTLCTDDVVLVSHLPAADPAVGELVTFRRPGDAENTVKRVVAVAGQEVRLVDAQLVVDGVAVPEPYVNLATIDGVYFGPVTVPAGSVFVMGDDREVSIDSRHFGTLPLSALDGRVAATLTHGSCPVR